VNLGPADAAEPDTGRDLAVIDICASGPWTFGGAASGSDSAAEAGAAPARTAKTAPTAMQRSAVVMRVRLTYPPREVRT
jgi:hypothetical protein